MTFFFFFSKSAMFKNLDLYLRKIQISFYVKKKFRFAFKEDTNMFLY